MAIYRGPHVAVYQKFGQSAPAVAIESLPSVAAGTAYEVYENEVVATHNGDQDATYAWPSTGKIVYDKDVLGVKPYNFYPVTLTSGEDNIIIGEEHYSLGEASINVDKDATYLVDDVKGDVGATTAYIPFYDQTTSVSVSPSNPKVLNVVNGYLKSSGVVNGQQVFLKSDRQWIYAGVVASSFDGTNSGSESKIILNKDVNGNESYTRIVIGAPYQEIINTYYYDAGNDLPTTQVIYNAAGRKFTFPTGTTFNPKLAVGDVLTVQKDANNPFIEAGIVESIGSEQIVVTTDVIGGDGTYRILSAANVGSIDLYANTVFDPNGNFSAVRPGDIIYMDSSVTGETQASVTMVNNQVITFSTAHTDAETEDDQTSYTNYKATQILSGATIKLSSYSVERLIGFSQDNEKVGKLNAALTADGPTVEFKKTTTNGYIPAPGDLFGIFTGTTAPDKASHTVVSVVGTTDPLIWTITFDLDVPATTPVNTDFRSWTPRSQNKEVKATFRAISDVEHMNVVRIASLDDIINTYGPITPYNELSFMLANEYNISGKVVYGINVDATDPFAEYSLAMEALKGVDVYSHAFGTTDPSVNGMIASYVDAEADPYIGHERIGIAAFDDEDIYKFVSGSTFSFDGTTLISDTNLLEPENEVARGDIFVITDNDKSGTYIATASPVSNTTIDLEFVSGDDMSGSLNDPFEVFVGTPYRQATRLSELSLGNRRVTSLFPGWFEAEYDGETKMFPPYFISAAIAGMDGGIIVSQSFTNYAFSIGGLSNYKLKTNSKFNKLLLDEIGSAGIDIMIQGAPVSQVISSRHDLTSNMDSIEFRERSITKQVDVVAKTMRAVVNPYVGKYNVDDNLLGFIRKIVTIACRKLENDSIVKSVTIASVARDKDIKDKINIILNVTVFVAGNYYDITLNVNS